MKKIEPLFQVDTFEEIVKNTKEVHKDLKSLGCFQAVNIEVDTLPDPSQEIYQVPRSRVQHIVGDTDWLV